MSVQNLGGGSDGSHHTPSAVPWQQAQEWKGVRELRRAIEGRGKKTNLMSVCTYYSWRARSMSVLHAFFTTIPFGHAR